MIKDNEQEIKNIPTEKWNFCYSGSLCNILVIISCASLWHMECKKVKNVPRIRKSFNLKLDVCLFRLKKSHSRRKLKNCASKLDTLMLQLTRKVIRN